MDELINADVQVCLLRLFIGSPGDFLSCLDSCLLHCSHFFFFFSPLLKFFGTFLHSLTFLFLCVASFTLLENLWQPQWSVCNFSSFLNQLFELSFKICWNLFSSLNAVFAITVWPLLVEVNIITSYTSFHFKDHSCLFLELYNLLKFNQIIILLSVKCSPCCLTP